MIFKDFLDTISYFYYPKGKSVFDIDYNRTIETKRYLEKVHFNYINNLETILDIDFPILFTFNANGNKTYLAYVTKFERRKGILDILFFPST